MLVYLCIHQTALQMPKNDVDIIKTKEKWRIRNISHHPKDPGWERARYCQCHQGIRESGEMEKRFRKEPVYIIDAVKIESGKHAIRSMFKITDFRPCQSIRGSQDLLFKDYYFAPKNKSKVQHVQEIKGLKNFTGVQVKKLDDYEPEKIVKKIQKTYEHVSKGKRPSSIHPMDWKTYWKIHRIRHVCG